MRLRLQTGIWAQTLAELRRCGGDHLECVVYWLAASDAPQHVGTVVHPCHFSTSSFYEVDADWLHEFTVSLRRDRRMVVAQVHTHAGRAFHSRTDDENALVNVPGFLSLVVPRFARAPVQTEELYLAELARDGRWERVQFDEYIGGHQ